MTHPTTDSAWSTRLLINKYEPTTRPRRRAPAPVRIALRSLGTVAPDRAARFAERLYFSPRRHPMPARERAWMIDTEHTRVDTDAGALSLYTWAPSPFPWEPTRGTILLAHGWEGRATQMGAFAAPLTARGFTVAALDAPAHGRSPGDETDLFSYARALRTVIDRIGDVRAVLTHSAGAGALYLALDAGASLEAAVLVAPPSDFSWIASSFARALDLREDTERRFRLRIAQRLGEDIWDRFSLDALATHLKMPALVVHDEDDDELPITHAETLVARWPAARLSRTRGLGHRRVLRDENVVTEVSTFLDTVLAGQAAFRPA